jgi:N-acetylmuramic acid 6-phosphate etherase
MTFVKSTEQESLYKDLEKKSALEIISDISTEDKKVAFAVEKNIPIIAALAEEISLRMKQGGRLFYIGAGTSGRLGILDASECPPTYGVSPDLVIGIIAGGDLAIRRSIEKAEDNTEQAWLDLCEHHIGALDTVVGIAASGTTPYVIGGLQKCRSNNILTASISCNANAPISHHADFVIEAVVGPEYVTGSTRMKSGTAQKMILNMITTSVMILLGRVRGNKMVDMQLSNEKLIDRGTKMIVEKTGLNYQEAKALLEDKGSVRAAIDSLN